MGIKRIEKIRTEEIRARAGVANISGNIREARLRWLGRVLKKTERCSNEIVEVSGHGKTKTELERCCTMKYTVERSSTKPENMENESSMGKQTGKRPEKKK